METLITRWQDPKFTKERKNTLMTMNTPTKVGMAFHWKTKFPSTITLILIKNNYSKAIFVWTISLILLKLA